MSTKKLDPVGVSQLWKKVTDLFFNNISRSAGITAAGKYALDAIEKNPNVSGTMAKDIKTATDHMTQKATTSVLGHVKVSTSNTVTDSTGLALAATEKNPNVSGSLAKQLSEISSNLTQNTDGKFVLPNGLKICWGIASTTDGLSTIIFPVTFQNNPIVNAIMTGMSYNVSLIVPMIQSISTSKAEIRLTYYNGQWLGAAGENIAWIAIGY